MKGFDIISNPNSHVTKSTLIGGLLSLIAVIIAGVLFWNEWSTFTDRKISKNLFVDHNSVQETLLVTLSINLRFAPCAILSLDVHDDLQHHRVDISVDKIRIDRGGKELNKVN